jgi:hypothetical protein
MLATSETPSLPPGAGNDHESIMTTHSAKDDDLDFGGFPFIDPNAFRNSEDYGKAHSRSVLNICTIESELKDQEGRKDRLVEKKVSY